jgi:branched-chain amino acid transport system permease protein
MKPLIRKGASILLLMIASLAVDILYTGVQSDIVTIGFAPFSGAFIHAGWPTLVQAAPLPDFTILGQSGLLIVYPVILAIVTALMYLLLKRTRFGIAMRAAIENPSLARIVGINVERVYLISWLIAGGLGGLAGCLYAIGDGMSLGIQSTLILDIFAGSVLGGLSSIYGAVIGGMLVAVGENYVLGVLANTVNSQISLLAIGGVSMIILIITLLIAPKGLVAVNWRKLFLRRR